MWAKIAVSLSVIEVSLDKSVLSESVLGICERFEKQTQVMRGRAIGKKGSV